MSDALRRGAEQALEALGRGFLSHPGNEDLRTEYRGGTLDPGEYLGELLRCVFRLLFLFTAEARDLLPSPQTDDRARERYARAYSVFRLRRGSGAGAGERPPPKAEGGALWESLKTVFRGLANGEPHLGLPPLAGIFERRHCLRLEAASLDDEALLCALEQLTEVGVGEDRTPMDWREITPEQLGCVYESLLDLSAEVPENGGLFMLTPGAGTKGNARRTTGSYYTPDGLVQQLLDRALEPVIAATLAAQGPEPRVEALLELAIVDPACGAGHFLVAVARRLADHVARLQQKGASRPEARQEALRSVIRQCLYGVDLNPMAVELCKISLWLEAADPGLPLTFADSHLQCGNALLGAPPDLVGRDSPTGDGEADPPGLGADPWCAALLQQKEASHELAAQYSVFHWQLRFAVVFARGGFDVVLGNPPWIAHAGRAAQGLPPSLKSFYQRNYAAFAGYPTTHGMFTTLAARCLRPRGYLGLVVPSSLSDLDGYVPTRRAHDALCEFPEELVDFGEGQFPGVTQPCMALVSRRCVSGRRDAEPGSPWPVERPDLDDCARGLLERLSRMAPLPAELFGERGLQSNRALAVHFRECAEPSGRFSTPIREGVDVLPFQLLPPRLHVDRMALGGSLRSAEAFAAVRVLIRQTARYPIAALSDGIAFRNSLVAAFDSPAWPGPALVALLNSALVRWLHYQRFRDARQPVLPQLKIAHLRAIPAPPDVGSGERERLCHLGCVLTENGGAGAASLRFEVDALVATLFGLSAAERALVSGWHERYGTIRSRLSRRVRAAGRNPV